MDRNFAWILLAYASALVVAIVTATLVDLEHPFWVAAAADVAATLAIFAYSFRFDNSSFYDPYWSVAPLPIVLYWGLCPIEDAVPRLRHVVVIALVCMWGVRLTWNWARGWGGLEDEDWRYRQLRGEHGGRYWIVSLFGLHLMPTIWVLFGCLPLYAAMAAPRHPFGWIDVLATLVTGAAVYIEYRADEELRAFRRSGRPSGEYLSSGLWSRSRHPNYFGEMSFWWGLYLFGLAADPSYWWTGIGALSITVMFITVSVPMIDKRMLERRPRYADQMKRVAAIIPWPQG